MPIVFNQIPNILRVPGQYIEFDNSRAFRGLPPVLHRILVIGQRFSAGIVAAGVPARILSGDQGDLFFGRGSMLAEMVKALKEANPFTETWAIAVDEPAVGVASAGTIKFSGTLGADGVLDVYIAGKRVRIGAEKDDGGSVLASAFAQTVNAMTDLPVTAAVDAQDDEQVNLTCRWKGVTGNAIDFRLGYYIGDFTRVPGITVSLNGQPAQGVSCATLANGAGSPDAAAFAPIGSALNSTHYHTVITPFTDGLQGLEDILEGLWGPMTQMEAQAFTAYRGATTQQDPKGVGDTQTFGEGRNSQFVTVMGAGKSPTPPWVWAAVTGAVDAFEPDPARPRQTLRLPGVLPPAPQDLFSVIERTGLLYSGISTYSVDRGGDVRIERLVTTYQTNPQGVEDPSYLDIETMRTLAYLRLSVRSRILLKFPRHKLADDGTFFGAGQPIVTPKIIRNELIALFGEWMEAGLVENLGQFKTDLIVERNGSDRNRVDAVIPPDVINQLRIFAAQIQFRL